jgi:hypothetical protein
VKEAERFEDGFRRIALDLRLLVMRKCGSELDLTLVGERRDSVF